jgi:hypothetical protein
MFRRRRKNPFQDGSADFVKEVAKKARPPLSPTVPLRFWLVVVAAGAALHVPLLVPQPKPPSIAERSLVAQAEAVLRGGPRVDEKLDYATFFLRAESADGPFEQAQWATLTGHLAETARPFGGPQLDTGVANMLLVLFRDAGLSHYRREAAGLSAFLSPPAHAAEGNGKSGASSLGGNCEAQTKLLVASFRAAQFALPDGVELGVEVFQDHVQAVLVDRKKGTVWNLLTGEQGGPPKSDVYRPAILLAAYLRGLGRVPPVNESALLLLRAPRPPRQAGIAGPPPSFYTSSTLRLPAARVRFATELPPENTDVPFPLLHDASGRQTVTEIDKDVTYREAFVTHLDERLLFPIDRARGPFGVVGNSLVFRQRVDAEAYLALKTPGERRSFLFERAAQRLREELGDTPPELPSLRGVPALSEARLAMLLDKLQRLEWLLGLAEQGIDRSLRSSAVVSALELRVPELSRVAQSIRAFSEEAGKEPELFFGRLGALDPTRRRRLIAFFVPRLQSAHVRSLSQALAEPGRVAIDARPATTNAPGPRPGVGQVTELEMEIELLPDENAAPRAALTVPGGAASPASSPSATPSTHASAHPTGLVAPSDSASPAPALVPAALAVLPSEVPDPLPIQAFLDVILSGLFSSGTGDEALPVLRRWDQRASEALLARVERQDDCFDTLARLRHSVLRPLAETETAVPRHLAELEKHLDRACVHLKK